MSDTEERTGGAPSTPPDSPPAPSSAPAEPEGASTGKTPAGKDGAMASASAGTTDASRPVREIGGPSGPEPTRYGDWERKGICVDF